MPATAKSVVTSKASKASKASTTAAPRLTKAPPPRMSLPEAMSALEKAGTAQARKTYARHGASEPMFGVSFATLKTLVKRIRVDQDLALALWDTGNFDARILALKVADPARMSPGDLDRWSQALTGGWGGYLAHLVAEGPHARAKADQWLAARSEQHRHAAWELIRAMAMIDETTPDTWFEAHLSEIERTIHSSPNPIREAMNQSVIAIGCRSAALRKKAAAAAKRIGKVDVDHGDTACKTPEAARYIDKAWAHSLSKGFESPAAHERARESMRTRC